MANKKWEYYVGVHTRTNGVKYVTSLGDHHMAYWNDGEDAREFSESFAKDIVQGLLFNGYVAFVVKAYAGTLKLKNDGEKEMKQAS